MSVSNNIQPTIISNPFNFTVDGIVQLVTGSEGGVPVLYVGNFTNPTLLNSLSQRHYVGQFAEWNFPDGAGGAFVAKMMFASDGVYVGDGTGPLTYKMLDFDSQRVTCQSLLVGGGIGMDAGGNISASQYQINGVRVVSDQEGSIADATGAGDVVARVNDILSALRAHGLIST